MALKCMKHRTIHTTTDNPHYRIITVEEPLSIAAESYRRIKTSTSYSNLFINAR